VLMSTVSEEESRAAARAYREKILGKR